MISNSSRIVSAADLRVWCSGMIGTTGCEGGQAEHAIHHLASDIVKAGTTQR